MTELRGNLSVFDAVGGMPAVRAAVEEFSLRLRADPDLAEYFVDVDMVKFKAHQRAFLAAAIGGPEVYEGRDMAAAHGHLAITDADFDAVVRHLVDTLAGLGLPTPVLAGIGAKLAPLRAVIVTAPPAAASA
jgi:hemoglobin